MMLVSYNPVKSSVYLESIGDGDYTAAGIQDSFIDGRMLPWLHISNSTMHAE